MSFKTNFYKLQDGKMRKAALLSAGLSLLVSVAAEAAMVPHTISFTQLYKAPGNPGLTGQISIDSSLLGAGQENKTHILHPDRSMIWDNATMSFVFVPPPPGTQAPLVSDFLVFQDTGSGQRQYEWLRPVQSPSVYSFKPLTIYTDSAGEVSNITSFLYRTDNLAGQVELGRSGGASLIGDPLAENEWILMQPLAGVMGFPSTGNVAVAAGYYYIERTSPIPIPGAVWLLGTGLLGLVGLHRKT